MGTQTQTLDQIVQSLETRGKLTSPINAGSKDSSLRNPTRAQLSAALIRNGATLSGDGRSYSWEDSKDLVTEVSHVLYRDQLSARADLLYGNEDAGEIPFDETDLVRAITFGARASLPTGSATVASQRTPQALALSKFLRNGGLGGHYIGTENGNPLVANRDGELLSDKEVQQKIDAVRAHIAPEDIVCATALTLGYDEERVLEDQEWLIGSFARGLPTDWETPITPARLAQTVAKGMKDLANAYLWKAIPTAVENVFGKKETTQPFQAEVMSRLHDRYVPINEKGATTVLDENKKLLSINELVSRTVRDVSYDLVSGKITLDHSTQSSVDQTQYDELSQEVDRLTTLLGKYETETQADAQRIEALESDLQLFTGTIVPGVQRQAREFFEYAERVLGVGLSEFEEALPEGAGPVLTYIGGLNSALTDRDSRIVDLERELHEQTADYQTTLAEEVAKALAKGEEVATRAYGADLAVLADRVAGLERNATRDQTLLGETRTLLAEALESNGRWETALAEQERRYSELDTNYNALWDRAETQAQELRAQDKTIASYKEGQRMLTDMARKKGMIPKGVNLTVGNFETAIDRLVVPYQARIVTAEEELRQATQTPEAPKLYHRNKDQIKKADF